MILDLIGALAFWIVVGIGSWWILNKIGLRFVVRRW